MKSYVTTYLSQAMRSLRYVPRACHFVGPKYCKNWAVASSRALHLPAIRHLSIAAGKSAKYVNVVGELHSESWGTLGSDLVTPHMHALSARYCYQWLSNATVAYASGHARLEASNTVVGVLDSKQHHRHHYQERSSTM